MEGRSEKKTIREKKRYRKRRSDKRKEKSKQYEREREREKKKRTHTHNDMNHSKHERPGTNRRPNAAIKEKQTHKKTRSDRALESTPRMNCPAQNPTASAPHSPAPPRQLTAKPVCYPLPLCSSPLLSPLPLPLPAALPLAMPALRMPPRRPQNAIIGV